MRIRLTQRNIRRLFNALENKKLTARIIAEQCGVSPRTISDWRRGVFTIPLSSYKHLVRVSGLRKEEMQGIKLQDFWHMNAASRKGALERLRRYGNFGTPEGRKRGGEKAYQILKARGNIFYNVKSIKKPLPSDALAEFLGIMCGDGHLSRYQASMTTNSITDIQHALFVKESFKNLFGVEGVLKKKRNENAVNVVASSKKLVQFLMQKGMPLGNKIQKNLSVPLWIYQRTSYQKAFIRGLFDTDGCVYLDRHSIKGKLYGNIGWTITTHADTLMLGVLTILRGLQFFPTNTKRQKSAYLRRSKDIERYFSEIGSHNEKHLNRYRRFLEWRVAPNGKAPVSKTGAPQGA